MEIVRDLVPPTARKVIYALYIVAGLVIGAIAVATGGLEWTAAAERVLAYLAVPLAILAGVNVHGAGDTDYEGYYGDVADDDDADL